MATILQRTSDSFGLECDVCHHQKILSPAISFCKVCEEALCRSCDHVHRNQKLTRDHKLLIGEQLPSFSVIHRVPGSVMTCDNHQMEIKYFCKTENTIWCEKCKMTSGRTCDLADINSHSQNSSSKSSLKAANETLKEIDDSFQKLEKTKTLNKKTLQTSVDGCIQEVRRMRKEFDDLLDKLEANLIKEIKDLDKKLVKDIDEHIMMAKGTLQEVRRKILELEKCKESGNVAVMYVGAKKSENKIMEYKRIRDALRNDPRNISVQYIPSATITSALKELKTFGLIESIVPTRSNVSQSLLDLAASDINHHKFGCNRVQSIVFMPSDYVVLACSFDGLILFDKDFKQSSKLTLHATNACRVSDTEVLVSQGMNNTIQYVEVLPNMAAKPAKKIGKSPLGVCFHNGEIYMTCKDKDSNRGEFNILRRNGEFQRSLGIRDGKSIFNLPLDVKVNRDGDRVFVTDIVNNTVTCLDQNSHVIYKYSNRELQTPEGIFVDGEDNVLICGNKSNNVHVIDKDGKKHQIVLQKKDGIKKHICIAYRHSDGIMAVGVENAEQLSFVTFKTRAIPGISEQLRKNLQAAIIPVLTSSGARALKNPFE